MVIICGLLASGTHSRDWGITGRQFCPPPHLSCRSTNKYVAHVDDRLPYIIIRFLIIIKKLASTRVYAYIYIYIYIYFIYRHTRRIVDVRNTCACTMERLAVLSSLFFSLSLSLSLPLSVNTEYHQIFDTAQFRWVETPVRLVREDDLQYVHVSATIDGDARNDLPCVRRKSNSPRFQRFRSLLRIASDGS